MSYLRVCSKWAKSIFLSLLILFVSVFGIVSSVSADQVKLKNGDVLTGTVKKFGSGILVFQTKYAKPISIKVSEIRSVSTDAPIEVHLIDGQVIKGRLSEDEDNNVLIISEIGVMASVGWDKIEAINPPPVKWTGSVNLGASVESGNSDRISASAGGDAIRKTKKDRFSMKFLYNYAEEEEEIVTRNAYGALKYDYLFLKWLYAYIAIEMYSDEFQDLNLRTIVGPGMGLRIWDDDVKKLMLEAGAVYVNNDYELAEDEDEINGRGAASFAWTIADTIGFGDEFVYYQSFDDDSYQIRNEAYITSALSQSWAMRISHILLYDSDPPPTICDTDSIYVLALQYKF